MRKTLTLFLAFALLCILSFPAFAQESRGSILGTITDAQKAVVPGAEVVVTNVGTNRSRTTISNDAGYYEVPLLDAGEYTVSAELSGFRKYVRSGITVNVASKVKIDIQLEIGEVQQIIEVTGAAPLLETTTASAGRIIDTNQLSSLPFSDLNPFALAGMAGGMQWTGQPEYRRPFDNGGTSAFNTSGGVGQNEYTIDGAPVTGTNRRVGFNPPADAVQEFNLQTTAFDATVGHTSGAVINVISRSGTNAFHGSLYDQHWQQRWNATPHFTRLLWEKDVASGAKSPDTPKQAPGRSNQFGATLGGPVRMPWLYNGKDKFFFFFSYNGIYQKKAETTSSIQRTVPKANWRQGDFSDLLALDAAKFQIYDPRTARLEGGKVVRDPFVGNKGIPILNPLYKYYEKLYPLPNDPPGMVQDDGTNNYLAANMPKDERFNSILNRYDYNISDKHRLSGKWYWNHRLADEYDWTYETMRGLMRNGLVRINKGGSGDWTWTLNNNNIFQLSTSWARFNEGNERDVPNQFTPSDVGLPAYLDERAGDRHLLPTLDFDDAGVEDIGQAYAQINIRGTTGEWKGSMVTIHGNHSWKYGWEERRYWTPTAGYGYTSGRFYFRRDYMRKDDSDTRAAQLGLDWASFMMGLPNQMYIDTNDNAYWSTRFRSLYFHDDWRVSPRLALNLGLRYEREGGITERFDRGLSGEFDPTMALPISSIAEAAYATVYSNWSSKVAGLPSPSDFKVKGGVNYLGVANDTFTNGTHTFLPRLGAVYRITDKTVIRGGYGWFMDTFNTNNTRPSQDGYSQQTSTTITNDRGLTFCCGIGSVANLSSALTAFTDPFPVRADGSRFDQPYGNSLGAMIRVGRGFDTYPRDARPAFQQRWRLSVQRELRSNMAIEASYNGAYSKVPVSWYRADYLPGQYWATGNFRQQAIDDDLNKTVDNPFYIDNFKDFATSNPLLWKYMNTQGFFTSKTIRKHQLLRAFPQMTGGNNLRSLARPGQDYKDAEGVVQYHDAQISFERRMSDGFQTAFSWTKTFNTEAKNWMANEFDPEPSWTDTDNWRPNRFVWSSILRLPFGPKGRWAKEGVLSKVVGGWETSWIWQLQSGRSLGFNNRFFYGGVMEDEILKNWNHDQVWANDIHQWFDPLLTWNPNSDPNHPRYSQYQYCQQLLGTSKPNVALCNPPADFVGFEGRSAAQPGSYQVRMTPNRFSKVRGPGIQNWDIKILRRFAIRESLNTSFSVDLLNAFNKTNFSEPNTDPTSANFGIIGAQRGLSRVIQFNLRVDF
jgi:hypothetical protein